MTQSLTPNEQAEMGNAGHLAFPNKMNGQRLVAGRLCFCDFGGDHVESAVRDTNDQANTQPHSELAQPTTPSKADIEHLLRPGTGTQTACSCGKSFGLSTEAAQHVDWHIKTQALITTTLTQQRDELLAQLPKRDNRKGMDAYTNGYVEGKNEIIDQVTALLRGSTHD